MIECNYDIEIANDNIAKGAPVAVRNRVLESHMEIGTLIDMIKANDMKSVHNIVLLHLSAGNSNAQEFRRKLEEVVPGKTITIADHGVEINLNKTPF